MISVPLMLLLGASAPVQSAVPVQAPLPAQEPGGAERYTTLLAEYNEAYTGWIAEVQKLYAAAQAKGEELSEYPPQPVETFLPRFAAAAQDYAGTEQAVPFLSWVVSNGLYLGTDEVKAAANTLVAHHLASPQLEDFGPSLGQLDYLLGPGQAAEIAAKIEKLTPSAKLRAWATFERLKPKFQASKPGEPAFEAAKQEMLAVLAKAQDRFLQQTYDGEVTVRETFDLGMTAPDITGPDLDGVRFSLSDYQGQILFVDFWGDW